MIYYLYRITNLKNQKIYIGVHKTKNVNDGYMGSGVLIKKAIKKYGKDNFKKDILMFFKNENDMFKTESIIVNEEFINLRNTYNAMKGGKTGSFNYINENKLNCWNDKEKRRKVWESVPLEVRIKNGKKMGLKFGGQNKLSDNEIKIRLKKIENIDLNRLGWVKKVSKKLDISHTQTRRFIEKHYKGEYYRRNKQ